MGITHNVNNLTQKAAVFCTRKGFTFVEEGDVVEWLEAQTGKNLDTPGSSSLSEKNRAEKKTVQCRGSPLFKSSATLSK